MDVHKLVEQFYAFSEYLVGFVLNVIYLFVLALPLILIDMMLPQYITKYAIPFIPLAALYGMALKSATYAFYSIFVLKKSYYGLYFWHSFKENFFQSYLYYLIVTSLLYIGVSSSLILIELISPFFWVLMTLIVFALLSNLSYMTLQMALYDNLTMYQMMKNAITLTIIYAIISIAFVLGSVWLIYQFQIYAFRVIAFGIPVLAGFLILVQRMIGMNLETKEGN